MFTKPVRSIPLLFCRLDVYSGEIDTVFPDGTIYGSQPHDTPEYRALADRCGYLKPVELPGGWKGATADIAAYCIEHDIAHALVAEVLYHGPSRVIWGCAHGQFAPTAEILHEEELAVTLQAYARAGVLPASSAPKFSWHELRDRFIAVCDGRAVQAAAA